MEKLLFVSRIKVFPKKINESLKGGHSIGFNFFERNIRERGSWCICI